MGFSQISFLSTSEKSEFDGQTLTGLDRTSADLTPIRTNDHSMVFTDRKIFLIQVKHSGLDFHLQ